MTVNTDENKTETTIPQEKIDTNSRQLKDDMNPRQEQNPQQSVENKKEDESKEDPNWRAFREARKKDRAEKESAERKAAEKEIEVAALKAAMEAAFSKSSTNLVETGNRSVVGYQEEESEDQRIEKKVQAALAAREVAAERIRQEKELQEYPIRLQQHFPDFNQTIASENLDYLEYHYPEVTAPLKRLDNGYEKWHDIYKAIKKFVPNSTTAKKEAAKAENNFNKPKSMSSTSITQSGEAVGSARLTEERRAANWERMQRTLKGLS